MPVLVALHTIWAWLYALAVYCCHSVFEMSPWMLLSCTVLSTEQSSTCCALLEHARLLRLPARHGQHSTSTGQWCHSKLACCRVTAQQIDRAAQHSMCQPLHTRKGPIMKQDRVQYNTTAPNQGSCECLTVCRTCSQNTKCAGRVLSACWAHAPGPPPSWPMAYCGQSQPCMC